ncbi:MFS general substrate transporter [Paxillus ammoniavirescens]|nr:MFS general substrate transporter [Paxillus ammoniavirescens]
MFFVPYSLLEFPSNLVIQVIRPSRWVPGIVVLWGLIMMLMGFVKTYPQLVGVRVCLVAAEAGLYPGVAYYLTMWYPKYMYQYRVGLFTARVGLAGNDETPFSVVRILTGYSGAFSGLLAYVIGFMGGKGGLLGWSWIFILEGVATILVGLLAAWVMVDYPSTAKFLTPEERSFIIEKRGHDDDAQDDEQDMSQQVWAAFTDWQVWALAIVQASIAIPGYAISFFLPSIIFGFGYSIPVTQFLTVPAYVVSAAMVLVFGYFSDKLKLRSPFVFAGQSVSMLGYIINITGAPSGVKFFGAYLCIIGTFACSPGPISWLANNLRGKYKRAVGIALQISVSTLGGLIGSNIFRAQDAPRYLLGHGLAIMFIGTGLVTLVITVLVYKHMNARLDREELVEKQQGRKVDPAPGLRYTL